MESFNSIENYNNKVSEPKVVDTVNFFGKYVDASAFKSKVITASASALFVAGIATYVFLF